MHPGNPTVVNKRMSFLSSLVWGLTSILIVAIMCATGVGFYGLRVVDGKTDSILDLARHVTGEVPQLIKALPPVFSDALHDRRAPDYIDDLEIVATVEERLQDPPYEKVVVTVRNRGSESVSLLSVRAAVLDDEGHLLFEKWGYVATPLAFDEEAPGPLLPGSTRRYSLGHTYFKTPATGSRQVEYEITDIRVWVPAENPAPLATANAGSVASVGQ